MKFGTKKSEAPLAGGNGIYMRNFPKGETKVRFLEEPDEWILYYEHYTTDGKAFPCTQETETCPGCTSEIESVQRRSRKYGTWVFNPQWNDTVPYKLAMTLANRLTARAERNGGTITNRDYVIIRSGEGLKTEYDVDQDERYVMDIDTLLGKAPMGSIEEVLQDMFSQVWGDPKQFDKPRKADEPAPKVTGTRATSPSAASTKESTTSADDVPDALLSKEELKAKYEGLDEFKKPETEDELTEAQVRAMTRDQLEALWMEAGWDTPADYDDWSKKQLVEEILKRAE